MTPVERFPSAEHPDFFVRDGEVSWEDLSSAVIEVCRKRGLLRIDRSEDSQSGKKIYLFHVGSSDQDAYVLGLVGWDDRVPADLKEIYGDSPHKLNAPQEIIDEVKLEIEQRREAAKFSSASSRT